MKFAWCIVLGLALLGAVGRAGGSLLPKPDAANRLIDVEHFEPDLLAREIFRETNEIRVRAGLPALKPEPKLATAAAAQAAMLALRVHGGHDNPLAHQGDPSARAMQEGLPTGLVGENAATLGARNRPAGRNYTYGEMATVLVQAWMDSAGHRANLLNPGFRYLGCGTRAAYLLRDNPVVYAIQDFYTPSPPPIELPPSVQPGATSISR
jgi:uncharacterized protein YkwD